MEKVARIREVNQSKWQKQKCLGCMLQVRKSKTIAEAIRNAYFPYRLRIFSYYYYFHYNIAGQPVVCDRYMELAALVNAINPAINATTDSLEVGELQKELLWLLHDQGHLKSFPMAIGIISD